KMVGWFKDMARDNAVTLLSQIREANLPVAPQEAAGVTCPVLLIGGAQSPAKYATRQDRLQALLPQSKRVRIALAAHGMNLANPRAFNRAVLEFIAGACGGSAGAGSPRHAQGMPGQPPGKPINASCAGTYHARPRPAWPWAI